MIEMLFLKNLNWIAGSAIGLTLLLVSSMLRLIKVPFSFLYVNTQCAQQLFDIN